MSCDGIYYCLFVTTIHYFANCKITLTENNSEILTQTHFPKLIDLVFGDPTELYIIFSENFTLHTIKLINRPVLIYDIRKISNLRKSNYVHLARSISNVDYDLGVIKSSLNWNRNSGGRSKFLLITETKREYLEEVYKKYWINNIFDLFIVLINKNSLSVGLYRANPFDRNSFCGREIKIKELDVITSEVNLQESLKNYKYINEEHHYDNCILTVSVLSKIFSEPYFFEGDKYNKSIMIRPLLLAKQQLNINLRILIENITKQFQYIKEENYIFKAYKYIDALGIGTGLDDVSYFKFDVTSSFYVDPYLWLVPKPKKLSHMKVLISIYDDIIWALLLTCAFVCCLFLFLINSYTKEESEFGKYINLIISYSLIAPIKFCPKALPAKILVFFYLISSMNICYLYQGQLIGVLTTPEYEKGINNVEDMIKSDLSIVPHLTVYRGLLTSQDPKVQQIVKKSTPSVLGGLQRLELLVRHQNISTTVMESYLISNKQYAKRIKVMGNKYLLPFTMNYPFKKYHPLYERINKLIEEAKAAGLNKKWLLDVENGQFTEEENINEPLNLTHLNGTFVLFLMGNLFGLIIFGFEIFYDKVIMDGKCKRITVKMNEIY